MRYRSILSALVLLFLGIGSAYAQTRIVTGRVTDSLTNEVVTSGQVSVQGTTTGSTIGDDGTFTIAVPVRDVCGNWGVKVLQRRAPVIPYFRS